MSKLTGKVAVVTASKGIGAAIAKSLASEGASVVVNYASSKAGADTVVAAIAAASPRPPGRRASLKQPSRTSADPATSPPSPSFWRPKTPPGSPVNNFSLEQTCPTVR
jgi:NAD(P)-dependent dehydrogenase (short-subunit alcohol dehydrogenase family)